MEQSQNIPKKEYSPIDWEHLGAFLDSVTEQMKETDRQLQETDRLIKETDKQMKETDRKLQETDRLIKETDRQMKETDRKVKETSEQIGKSDSDFQKMKDNIWKTIDRITDQMDRLMKRTSILDNEWGRFLEEMCIPATIDIFMKEGIGITQRYTGITHAIDDDGDEMEVDAILCNTTEAVAIEVKSKCTKKDIDHFLKQLRIFKKVFHPFDKYKVYAAIVGVHFQHGVKEYACRNGLYVIDCPAEGLFSLSKRPSVERRLCL